jgi:hypothetical protein
VWRDVCEWVYRGSDRGADMYERSVGWRAVQWVYASRVWVSVDARSCVCDQWMSRRECGWDCMRSDVCEWLLWDDQWVEGVHAWSMDGARVWDVHPVWVFDRVHADGLCCERMWWWEPARDDVHSVVLTIRTTRTLWDCCRECEL